MKVIIAGSRTIRDYLQIVLAVRESGFEVTEVVCGGAAGVDALGKEWARDNDIPVKLFPADWSKGKAAGHIRNGEMARYAQALVAIHDGQSPGTADMIRQAERAGLLVYVKTVAACAAQGEG